MLRAWILPLVLALTLVGCRRDESKKQVKAARETYLALVEKGTNPRDPAFDALAEKLAAIPADADASKDAKALLQSIRRAQEQMPPRPLAKDGEADSPLGRERDRCVQLARQLGEAKPDAREALMAELAACKKRVEELSVEENKATHPPHPGDSHEGHGH